MQLAPELSAKSLTSKTNTALLAGFIALFALILSGIPAALAHPETDPACQKTESGDGTLIFNGVSITFVEDPAGVVTWNVEPGVTGTVYLYAGGVDSFLSYSYSAGTGTTPPNDNPKSGSFGQPKDLSHIHACLTVTIQGSPSELPTIEPSEEPTVEPSEEPTQEPTEEPSEEPTVEPEGSPSPLPSEEPTEEPSQEPSDEPTVEPQGSPSPLPSDDPTVEPEGSPDPSDPPVGDLGDPDDPATSAQGGNILPLKFADTGLGSLAGLGTTLVSIGAYVAVRRRLRS